MINALCRGGGWDLCALLMSKRKRGRKHRTPQKRLPRSPSVLRQRVAAAVLPEGALPLRGSLDHAARMLEHAKPDQLVELVLGGRCGRGEARQFSR